jgi:asparagine synthase (glutamine-hydrolysing)
MCDPATGNWLVFNGEIFNFQEIRVELERLGHRFCSHGDTEVLLKAYGEWGEACLERLRGMFAFALWEAKRERLFLARDRLGVKPLYYCSLPQGLVFSSEVRALLASGLVARRVDLAGVGSYLAFGAVQDPVTLIEGVRSLPPGTALVWQKGKCQEKTYWSMAEVAGREPATEDVAEAARRVREFLLEAISLRLISDVPLGVFLSGGMDSSSVLALASEVTRTPLETFSVVFAEREFSEADYSDVAAKAFGSRHHQIPLTQKQLLEELPRALASMDQPSIDGVNTYVVSQATKKAGITVALSGLGGDEVFAGYGSFRNVPKMMLFRRYAAWMRPLWRGLERHVGPHDTNLRAKLLGLAAESYLGSHPYFLSRALFLPRNINGLLQPHGISNDHNPGYARLGHVVQGIEGLDPINQVSVLEASTYMANMLLRDTDTMSMAHALEVRVPLLDHKLWEYVLPLRGRLKLDRRYPKPLLLKAVGPRLPEEIYLRRKMGFHLPFAHWMQGALRPTIERELRDGADPALCPVNPPEVAAVWEAFLRGKTSWSRPWALFVLKQWVRRNIQAVA